MADWYVKHEGEPKQGPFSPKQLKSLADRGEIDETTPIRRVTESRYVPAGKLKGLFDTPSPTEVARVPCKTCGELIPSVARVCRFCDRPCHEAPPPQTSELTGKYWKAIQASGCLTSIVALFVGLFLVSDPLGNDTGVAIAWVITVLGLVAYAFGRVGGWWDHG